MINPFAAIFDEKGNPVEVLNYFVVRQWFLDRETFFGRISRDRDDTNERR